MLKLATALLKGPSDATTPYAPPDFSLLPGTNTSALPTAGAATTGTGGLGVPQPWPICLYRPPASLEVATIVSPIWTSLYMHLLASHTQTQGSKEVCVLCVCVCVCVCVKLSMFYACVHAPTSLHVHPLASHMQTQGGRSRCAHVNVNVARACACVRA